MTVTGWIVMLASVGFVTGLTIWCVGRVLRTPDATEHIHGPADIEPQDPDG